MPYLHNYYPSATEKIKVTNGVLSDYQLKITEDNTFFLGKNKKNISNLGNNRNSLSRLKTLDLKLRLQFKKTHRVLLSA